MNDIGTRIRELRKSHKLTQGELAEKLNIAQSTIGMIETNKREPSNELLVKIANFFNVTTDYLLGREAKNTYTGKELADLVPEEWRDAIKEVEYFEFYKKMKKEEINPDDLIEAYKVYKKIKEDIEKKNKNNP